MTRALLKFLSGQSELHALAAVVINDRGRVAAGELNLRGQSAVVQLLITVQIEQRILAVQSVELFRD